LPLKVLVKNIATATTTTTTNTTYYTTTSTTTLLATTTTTSTADHYYYFIGEASAILAKATATAEGIERLSSAILNKGGTQAVSLRIAEQYVSAFSQLAKKVC